MPNPQPLDLSWLGGLIGGAASPGRDTNAGGSIYGGTRNLSKDMLEGVGTATDEQFAQDAKKAKSLRALLKTYGPAYGMPELADHADVMGLGDLEAKLQSIVLQKADAERKSIDDSRKMQEQAAYMNILRQSQEMNDTAAGNAAVGRGLSALANRPPEYLDRNPGATNWERFLAGAGPDAGKSRDLVALAHYLQQGESKGGWNLQPGDVMPVGNGHIAVPNSPNSYSVVPNSNAPDYTLPANLPQVLGYSPVPKGNGQVEWLRNPLPPDVASRLSQLDMQRVAAAGELAKLDQQMAEEPNNRKPGLDLWPFNTTYAAQREEKRLELAKIEAEANALRQSAGPSAAPAATTAPATNAPSMLQAFQAWQNRQNRQ